MNELKGSESKLDRTLLKIVNKNYNENCFNFKGIVHPKMEIPVYISLYC